MVQPIRTIEATLKRRGTVRLPAVFIEECAPSKDTILNVHYGKNYSCVLIVPKGVKISDRQQERISIILNEALTA